MWVSTDSCKEGTIVVVASKLNLIQPVGRGLQDVEGLGVMDCQAYEWALKDLLISLGRGIVKDLKDIVFLG